MLKVQAEQTILSILGTPRYHEHENNPIERLEFTLGYKTACIHILKW